MSAIVNSNGVPILGEAKIVVTMLPGKLAGTFDVQIDTTHFQFGTPLAVQCLMQAVVSLIPVAYTAILESSRQEKGNQ